MTQHPFGVWTLRGVPNTENPEAVPSPADLESWGATWRPASYDYLIGICARAYDRNAETASMPAFIESQRRAHDAIGELRIAIQELRTTVDEFKSAATNQTAELISLATRADRQTTKMIGLTWAIGLLTVLLAILAAEGLGFHL